MYSTMRCRPTSSACQVATAALLLAALLCNPVHAVEVDVVGLPLGPDGLVPSFVQDALARLPSSNRSGDTSSFFLEVGSGNLMGMPLFPPPPGAPPRQQPGDAPGAPQTSNVLRDIMAPVPIEQRAAAGAAQGVVAASLLLTSGICITVGGGLGTASSALSGYLGLINGAAGRVNLGLTYGSAMLGVREKFGKNQDDYVDALGNLASALPAALERAAGVREALSNAGGFLTQLDAMRAQLVAARNNLASIRLAALGVATRR